MQTFPSGKGPFPLFFSLLFGATADASSVQFRPSDYSTFSLPGGSSFSDGSARLFHSGPDLPTPSLLCTPPSYRFLPFRLILQTNFLIFKEAVASDFLSLFVVSL